MEQAVSDGSEGVVLHTLLRDVGVTVGNLPPTLFRFLKRTAQPLFVREWADLAEFL